MAMPARKLRVAVKRDIFALAHEMAELMAERPEVIALRETENALVADPVSVALVEEYESAKRAVKRSKALPKDEQLRLINHFMAVEEEWNGNPLIQAYWTAREDMDKLMDHLNMIITYPLHGDESHTGGRNTGCSSGGGGCSTGGSCSCG